MSISHHISRCHTLMLALLLAGAPLERANAEPPSLIPQKPRPLPAGTSNGSAGQFDTFGFGSKRPSDTSKPQATQELVSTPEEASERVLRVIRQAQTATGAAEQSPPPPEGAATGEPQPTPETASITKRDTGALLPKDPRFWSWAEWYKEHGVVSLVVSGADNAHMLAQLRKLSELKQKKGVALGRIVIIGGGDNLSQTAVYAPPNMNASVLEDPAALRKALRVSSTEFGELCSALDVETAPQVDADAILSHFDISFSPAWIVRYQGRDYVFEGSTDISRNFTNDGRFIR